MKDKIMMILEFFFGKQPKIRFRRLIIYSLILITALSIRWSCTEKEGFQIEWKPFVEIEYSK